MATNKQVLPFYVVSIQPQIIYHQKIDSTADTMLSPMLQVHEASLLRSKEVALIHY